MASTYTSNIGLQKPGDNEQSGTWDDSLNTNFDQVDQATSGIVTVTLPATGSTGSPNEVKITNTSNRAELSDGRNLYIEFDDGGDLGGDAYVQFTPSTSKKIGYVTNNLTNGRSIFIFQGTYDSGRDYELTNGTTALIKVDGGGAGAATVEVISLGAGGGGGGSAIEDSDFSSNGLMTRTGSGAYTSRTLTAGNGVAVTNGNGVSGNPTVATSYTLSTSAPSGDPGVTGHVWYRY